jgi:hypothetical protein
MKTVKQPARNEALSCGYGCLFALVGGVVGFFIGEFIGDRMYRAAVEAIRAKEPDATIDFLPVITIVVSLVGAFVSALLGMVLAHLLSSRKPNGHLPDYDDL